MVMPQTTAAILGAGYIADWHCRALRDLRQVRGAPFAGCPCRDPANVLLEVGPHAAAHLLDLVGEPDRLTAEADRPTELPDGSPFYRRWRARAYRGATVVDVNFSFEAG